MKQQRTQQNKSDIELIKLVLISILVIFLLLTIMNYLGIFLYSYYYHEYSPICKSNNLNYKNGNIECYQITPEGRIARFKIIELNGDYKVSAVPIIDEG